MAILDQHFYNKTISLYTSVLGNCFNDISIARDGKIVRVPIAYAAIQKYNALADQNADPDLIRFMKRTPRMSFRLVSWGRDPARVKNKHFQMSNSHVVGVSSVDGLKVQYNRVPYKFGYIVDVTTKYIDDMLQIYEQIAVAFNPSIQVVVKDNPNIQDESAIVITVDDSQFQDNFEGLYESNREITCSFNVTLEGYLYMPVREGKTIRTVYVNYYDLDNPEQLLDQQYFDEDDAMTEEEKRKWRQGLTKS